MNAKTKDPFHTTFHRDGTVTYWNVFQQRWTTKPAKDIPASHLASFPMRERNRILEIAWFEAGGYKQP